MTLLSSIETEQQFIAKIRAPDGVYSFNPGDSEDKFALNRLQREVWPDLFVFVPATLIDSLQIGTKMLVYSFSYRPQLTGGELLVYFDDSGRKLGCSYSRSLEKLKDVALLDDL